MAFNKKVPQKSSDGGAQTFDTYLRLTEGERIIRVLDHGVESFWRYWVSGAAFPGCGKGKGIVVAKNSPLRQYFEGLGKESSEYRFPNCRYLINVLDRTPVKKTAKGIVVYADAAGKFPATVDGENLANTPVMPNNKVYVLEFGKDLSDSFELLHERLKNRKTSQPMSIWEFDVKIITQGSGLATRRMVLPDDDQEPLSDDLTRLLKYDLSLFTRPLPDASQERLLKGEDYATVLRDLGWDRPTPTVAQDVDDELPF